MILLSEQSCIMRESDDGDRLQRCPFPPRGYSDGGALVCGDPLSTRHVEQRMEERGVEVDHSTINRWVITYSPQLEEAFHRRKRPVWAFPVHRRNFVRQIRITFLNKHLQALAKNEG